MLIKEVLEGEYNLGSPCYVSSTAFVWVYSLGSQVTSLTRNTQATTKHAVLFLIRGGRALSKTTVQ